MKRLMGLIGLLMVSVLLIGCAATVADDAGFDGAVKDKLLEKAAANEGAAALAAAPQAQSEPVVINTTVNVTMTETTVDGASSDSAEFMTEEEMLIAIDEAVAEANAQSEAYVASTAEVTADGEVTQEEVATLEVYVYGAEEAIAEAEELVESYEEVYGEIESELATAAVTELETISAELNTISTELATMNDTLAQGLILAEDTVAGLQDSADSINTQIAQVQADVDGWVAEVNQNIDDGAYADEIEASIVQAEQYMQSAQDALADGTISAEELAQLSAASDQIIAELEAQDTTQAQIAANAVSEMASALEQGGGEQANAVIQEV